MVKVTHPQGPAGKVTHRLAEAFIQSQFVFCKGILMTVFCACSSEIADGCEEMETCDSFVFHPCHENNKDILCRLLLMAVGISQGPTAHGKVCSEHRRQSSQVFFPLSPSLSLPGARNHRRDGEPPSLHAKIIY